MISEEIREFTCEYNCYVFRCDNGCRNEIFTRNTFGHTVRRAVDEWADETGWFEIASAADKPGLIFCSWHCIATYAAKAALKVPLGTLARV